jgi:hypothetical protein
MCIDLNPPYQRGAVWTKKRQQGLVESFIQGYPVPNIMLSQYELKRFRAIDGKQRVQALFDFMNNKFSVQLPNGDHQRFADLGIEDRLKFENTKISVAVKTGLSIEAESKIFERINRAAPLSNGELIHSYIDCALVRERDAFVLSTIYARLSDVIGDFHNNQADKRMDKIANLTGLVAGAGAGVDYITTSFKNLYAMLEASDEQWDSKHTICTINLERLARLWEGIKANGTVLPQRWVGKSRVWKLAFLHGYMLYSFHQINDDLSEANVLRYWSRFIRDAASDTSILSQWEVSIDCRNKNLDSRRLQRGWSSVMYFVDHGCFHHDEETSYSSEEEL